MGVFKFWQDSKSHKYLIYNWFLEFFYIRRMTALIVKVLSMIAERQQFAIGEQGRVARVVPLSQIQQSVGYLLSVQQDDGSFDDPHPVLHRGMMVFMTMSKCIQAKPTSDMHRGSNSIIFVCLITDWRGQQTFHDGLCNNCTVSIIESAGRTKS